MSAVINLKHEPKLREAFEYAHVVNNTVLIDRRTKWGNPWRVGHDPTSTVPFKSKRLNPGVDFGIERDFRLTA